MAQSYKSRAHLTKIWASENFPSNFDPYNLGQKIPNSPNPNAGGPTMKKKKQKQIATSSAAGAADYIDGELKSAIHSHAEFFDHLIELIPARFYLPKDDDDSKPWYPGLSKAAKASLKLQSRQNLKLSRRQRLDPDSKPSSSTLHLLQQQQNTKIPQSDGVGFVNLGEDGESQDKTIDAEENKEKTATYEALRQKLRKKIELLRGNRGEKKSEDNRMRNDANKRKRGGENDGGESGKEVHLDDDDDEEIIEYGKVRLEDDQDRKNKKDKKRKLSKAKELEKAKRLQEVKEKPGIAERESWKAAESRAMGVKVHDDPRLIKESMKREKRKREKNAEKWKERVETQQKMKGERQKKRKENIVGRIKEKKMRKIAKREKKLMRPGFEGRKEGFITQN